ncbi:PD-(D/E)XK nuclease family protein [Candidatus Kaiserbacteria bacterium]|nr:PD-(D/E)XK nuclease family protein [Candidatus Kaiserbacteria bacterium]USN88705.1 MAG: PD-(D/E)XK nuclease family protein [Candidatus Nomurabacteria bacterium]
MAEYVKKYNPNRHADWNYGGAKWKLSRSKIDFFFECPRCFYLDNVLGTKRPGFPSFNLNIAVDELFKKEFDVHRAAKTKHPIFEKYNLDALPFEHKSMDEWRDPFVGIMHTHEPTGLIVSGGVDDIWVTSEGKLIIADYKSTSKEGKIEKLGDSPWEQQYTRQLGVYRWLLEQNGFEVEKTGYLVYANASKDEPGFDDKLVFDTTLVPVTTDISWIEPALMDIKACLDRKDLPPTGPSCEFCPYREASGKKLQAIHFANKK